MTGKPACDTCTIKRCPLFSYNGGKPTDSSVHNRIVSDMEKTGCLSHPNAREWLMRDAIKFLEKRRIETHDELVNEYLHDAIEVIKNGVNAEAYHGR